MKFGVVIFPGSNCDHDTYHVISKIVGQPVHFLWHRNRTVENCDVVILPGGFSYGDYLRCGAIASFSPVMQAIKEFAARGGLILGICNGFQILCEAGLLPGALLRNHKLKFICEHVYLRVETNDSAFLKYYYPLQVVNIPIAHAEGCYYCTKEELDELVREHRVAFRYCTKEGKVDPSANPNGSIDNIAGIFNREKNVLGMMPHPERASEELLGSIDGRTLFESLAIHLAKLEKSR
ncbi:MAG: phosphoribosylformylglycinamidine synthase subunit PurQ [Acidobacteriota bacterium]|nr:phosphoribosylformylglycinamidine synthase subunit PurQ [Blastocatellia bacterium]MDW8411986.1 phosphoribosylformylglycinamidine synthase subunit PurQ [Acidobacteriota bacterium]